MDYGRVLHVVVRMVVYWALLLVVEMAVWLVDWKVLVQQDCTMVGKKVVGKDDCEVGVMV